MNASPQQDEKDLMNNKKSTIYLRFHTNYICALLNSKGGNLIIGSDIGNNNVIKGIKMTRENMDLFQRHLDECLKQFNPSVKGHEYTVNFKPVKADEVKKITLRDHYIIEVIIQGNPNLEDVYFTHYDECWIRKNASEIDLLPITELKAYMEKNLNQTFELKKSLLQKQINLYEGKGLETLNTEELKKLKTNILNSLAIIKAQKESKSIPE